MTCPFALASGATGPVVNGYACLWNAAAIECCRISLCPVHACCSLVHQITAQRMPQLHPEFKGKIIWDDMTFDQIPNWPLKLDWE
jgi:hypothetical protein